MSKRMKTYSMMFCLFIMYHTQLGEKNGIYENACGKQSTWYCFGIWQMFDIWFKFGARFVVSVSKFIVSSCKRNAKFTSSACSVVESFVSQSWKTVAFSWGVWLGEPYGNSKFDAFMLRQFMFPKLNIFGMAPLLFHSSNSNCGA